MQSVASPRIDPRTFGRRAPRPGGSALIDTGSSDARLFAWTFACGFVFMSVFLA